MGISEVRGAPGVVGRTSINPAPSGVASQLGVTSTSELGYSSQSSYVQGSALAGTGDGGGLFSGLEQVGADRQALLSALEERLEGAQGAEREELLRDAIDEYCDAILERLSLTGAGKDEVEAFRARAHEAVRQLAGREPPLSADALFQAFGDVCFIGEPGLIRLAVADGIRDGMSPAQIEAFVTSMVDAYAAYAHEHVTTASGGQIDDFAQKTLEACLALVHREPPLAADELRERVGDTVANLGVAVMKGSFDPTTIGGNTPTTGAGEAVEGIFRDGFVDLEKARRELAAELRERITPGMSPAEARQVAAEILDRYCAKATEELGLSGKGQEALQAYRRTALEAIDGLCAEQPPLDPDVLARLMVETITVSDLRLIDMVVQSHLTEGMTPAEMKDVLLEVLDGFAYLEEIRFEKLWRPGLGGIGSDQLQKYLNQAIADVLPLVFQQPPLPFDELLHKVQERLGDMNVAVQVTRGIWTSLNSILENLQKEVERKLREIM